MKKSNILIFVLFFISLKTVAQNNLLQYINDVNTLELKFTDDKCGEWGGNQSKIIIYRKSFNGPLLANFSLSTMDCDKGETKITKDKTAISLNASQIQLILDSLKQLVQQKLNRTDYPSHSGLYCSAILSDSSLQIEDFPSSDWEKFKELCTSLEN